MTEHAKIPAIEMRDLRINAMYDPDFVVLEHINWTVMPGEFWVIGGQQHSGKTDLLMATAGMMAPTDGCYHFFGTETRMFDEDRLQDRLRIGMLFEDCQLFGNLTVAQNIMLPLQYHANLTADDAREKTRMLLEMLELAPLADVTPANIARNWNKRAALARALVLKPEILLLDNPLAGLGTRHLQWWLRFLDALARGHAWLEGRPLTIISTTDDLRSWPSETRRFGVLRDKQFFQLGSWKDVTASKDVVVRELLAGPLEQVADLERSKE